MKLVMNSMTPAKHYDISITHCIVCGFAGDM